MAKDYAKAFYSSTRWIKCRLAYMRSVHWTCQRCDNPAVIAHHKKHITQQNITCIETLLSWDNLEALCRLCHEKEHSEIRGRRDEEVITHGLKFGACGEVIQVERNSIDYIIEQLTATGGGQAITSNHD